MTNGFLSAQFRGTLRDCVSCASRAQCLRAPTTTKVRHVAFFHGRVVADPLAPTPETQTSRVQQRVDAPEGRLRYGQRFARVEPVYGNLRFHKGLDDFTLRGAAQRERIRRATVNGQQQRVAKSPCVCAAPCGRVRLLKPRVGWLTRKSVRPVRAAASSRP